MLKKLRKSECPKEIFEVINEAISRQVIFIIWQSNRKNNNFIKTGTILKMHQEDIQVEVHDYHSQNSFIEEEFLSLEDIIYFRSSFFSFTFKASFISNSDDNSFWVKIPKEVLLVERREHLRAPLNSYNWKSSEFEVIERRFIPEDHFPIPDEDVELEEEKNKELFGPLIEDFRDWPSEEGGPDEGQLPLTKTEPDEGQLPLTKSEPSQTTELQDQTQAGKMNGTVIEISPKGASLLASEVAETPFSKGQILRFYSIEGVSVSSPPLEGVVKSLRSRNIQSEEDQENGHRFIQLGLEFNQFIDI